MGRGEIAVGGVRTSLRGRRERRGEVVGGGEGGVGGGRVGVGGVVGVEGGGGGVEAGPILVLVLGGELVGGERRRVVVGRAGRGRDGVGIGLGEPGGVLGVEGGKRSATRVGEMVISERMDWRELDAIVGGGIERNPLPLVVVEVGRRRVRGVRPLVVAPGEGGRVGVDRVCGGGHGSGGVRIGEAGRCRQRPAGGEDPRSTHFDEETRGEGGKR